MPKSGFFGHFPLKDRDPLYSWVLFPAQTGPTTNLRGGHVTFQVGDKVIYPNHGLGIVERIEDKTILGTTCGFYHLRIVANDTTVLVPVSNVDGVGLRRAIEDEEVERLFGAARRRQDRQPPELEGALQGQLRQDAQRLDLRRGRRAQEPDVPRQVEEPVVPREAHARSRQVPHHLRSLRSDARRRRSRSRGRRSIARSSAASWTKARMAARPRAAPRSPSREGCRRRRGGVASPARRDRTRRAPSSSCRFQAVVGPMVSKGCRIRQSPRTESRRRAFRFYDPAPFASIAAVRSSSPTSRRRSTSLIVAAPIGMLAGDGVRLEADGSTLRPRRRAARPGAVRHPLPRGGARARSRGDRAVVYCSNHQSNVDPPVLFEALHPRMHILYKAELRSRFPLLARAFDLGGFVPVDRGNREQAMRVDRCGGPSRCAPATRS